MVKTMPASFRCSFFSLVSFLAGTAWGQNENLPSLEMGRVTGSIRIDGVLDEADWDRAPSIPDLVMIEPVEGGIPTGRTHVRVLAGPSSVYFGFICEDPDPAGIVSFTKARDAELDDEDHIKIVLDPFRDGRTGYVLAVNPGGARYDALVANRGEEDNPSWDGIWEAATSRSDQGWSVEIRVPILTLSYKKGLEEWAFNVERRIQRLLETNRWASPERDYEITQTSRAGFLVGVPEFDLGLGLGVRPAVVGGYERPEPGSAVDGNGEPSLDVQQRLGPNLLSSLTVNTDFAETEVDARQTNLTRFPLFFPEKRTFFLEGSDIFDFGLGLGEDVIPFFSRRIGLVEGQEVPILAGGKLNGRVGETNLGALAVGTRSVEDLAPEAAMGVVRVQQNIFAESSVGGIATFGDPLGRTGSWLVGSDFTYQTSSFRGDKNFLVGVWGLTMSREDLTGDASAWGAKIDYPNDLWDVAFTYKRIGDAFDPSLGFVPRRAIKSYRSGLSYMPRPESDRVRQLFFEFRPELVTDLDSRWESYRVFTAPLNVDLESGDRFEYNFVPTGERLVLPFEIADGVVVPPGSYDWIRHRIEWESAAKRKLAALVTWWFGGFYGGELDEVEIEAIWTPSPIVTLSALLEKNVGELPGGSFDQSLVGVRVRFNISPDLELQSFIQYDDESVSWGTNTRLHWNFRPEGDFFLIYNHNVANILDRWYRDSDELIVKLQYMFRR
jgi:hypothetical protein